MQGFSIETDIGTYICINCGITVTLSGGSIIPPPCPDCGNNLYVKSIFNMNRLPKVQFIPDSEKRFALPA